MKIPDKEMKRLFEDGACKFQYGLEHDFKKLEGWLLENKFTKMSLIIELSIQGEHNIRIRDFLQSEYCTGEVVNSLMDLIKEEIDIYLDLENPRKRDMMCLYQLVHAQGVISCYCGDKF